MAWTQSILYFCLCFIAGIFFSSFFNLSQILILAFLFFAVFLIVFSFFLKKKTFSLIAFCFLFLFFGVLREQTARSQLVRPELKQFFGERITLEGIVIEEPEIYLNRVRLTIEIPLLKARLLATTNFYPEIQYNDKVQITGVLEEPPSFDGFDYQGYLQRHGIYFLMSYPKIEITEKHGFSLKYALIAFKQRLKQNIEKIFSFSQAGFFEALIFGDENNFSQEWKEKLNLTGVRHIAAVSGANVTILTTMLLNFLLFLGFWRRQAFWLCLVLIFSYILMIGAPACGVRAGIMAGLFLYAQHCGRIADPERLIVMALTIMLFFNPLLLKSDIGFQLSFLAVMGLIYLSPLFSNMFKKLPNILGLRINLASTLAAQIFVLPLLLYNFGQFTLLAPITNILILPAVPLLTIAGFVFSLVGIFSQKLAWFISLPIQFLMQIIIKTIDLFSLIPFNSFDIKVSWIFVAICYFLLSVFVFNLKKKQIPSFLDY